MTATYALVGAIAGMLLIYLGLNFHIGSTIYDGVTAYVGAAFGGALAAVVVRYSVRQAFGPIIP
jgi:hypothetical protein